MKRARIAGFAAAILVVICLPSGSPSAGRDLESADAQSRKVEWHQVVIRGRPAGYVQISVFPRDEGGFAVRTFMKMVISRGSRKLTLETLEEIEEDAKGKVVGFLLEQKMSKRTTVIRGRVQGEVLRVTTEVEGSPPRRSEVPFDPRSVGPHRAEALAREKLRQEGDSLELPVLFAEVQRCGTQKLTLGPLEDTKLLDGERQLRRVDVELSILPVAITHWVDGDFRMVKSSLPMLGMEVLTFRSTQEKILAADYSSPPEIFVSSKIPVRRRVPAGATRATYRLRWKKDPPAAKGLGFRRAPGHEVVRREAGDRVWILEVRAVAPAVPGKRAGKVEGELRSFLEPSPYVQSDSEKIQRLSREIVGEEQDRWKAAKRLERWVFKNVRAKNLDTGFASASEVLDTRTGDCTEHAVLLAALARAAGVPARLRAGLLYHRRFFVGHMWTEVHCGEWVPLDATLGKGRVGADHIALATSSPGDASVSEIFLKLVPLLGNLEIEVLETDVRAVGPRRGGR